MAEVVCSDGASVYTAQETQQFFQIWGVRHRVSSAYNAEANIRAEIGVKSAKRLIRDNVGHNGSLHTNNFAQALLAHRNTPDQNLKISPAEIVFGHKLRDIIPQPSYAPQESWKKLAAAREDSFFGRHYARCEKLEQTKRKLTELYVVDHVYVQDQAGPTLKH